MAAVKSHLKYFKGDKKKILVWIWILSSSLELKKIAIVNRVAQVKGNM